MLASLQIRKAKAFCLSYTHTMLGQKETEMNAIGPMTAATKESVLLIEAMYEDAHKGLVDEHWRVCVKPAMATDAGMATDIAMVTDAGMTTDEASTVNLNTTQHNYCFLYCMVHILFKPKHYIYT